MAAVGPSPVFCVDNEKTPDARASGLLVWWRFTDSNRGPVDYDSIALTD